ncbi:MAG: GFA family protein [Sphingomonadaceae bacterium]|nr:GFA family protein [Sphingomonadaceae bacterium]
MLDLSCHCGQLRVRLSKRPDFVHACNCSLCRASGAHWGYFHPSEVSVEGKAQGYSRQDKAEPAARIQFCPTCGGTTHFTLTEAAVAKFGNSLMGVNMLLADEQDLAGIELRFPDGQAWSGEGDFHYLREPRILGPEQRA